MPPRLTFSSRPARWRRRIAACEANLPGWHELEPRIGRDLMTFLGAAYQFKTRADYAIGSTATPLTPAEATAAIATTARFIDAITQVLPPGLTPPHGPRAQP